MILEERQIKNTAQDDFIHSMSVKEWKIYQQHLKLSWWMSRIRKKAQAFVDRRIERLLKKANEQVKR